MKTTFTAFLAIACFALTVECGPDPQFQKLNENIFRINNEIDKLTRQFEISATSGENNALNTILEEAKKLPHNISALQYDIKEMISKVGNSEHSFLQRLQEEFALININAKARQLKAVQLEILGITSGASKVPNYQFSESLTVTLNYVAGHFINTFIKLAEVDQLLEEARIKQKNDTHHIGETVLDQATKTKVLKGLKEFTTLMGQVKAEVVAKYYSVVEAMRLKNEELSLQIRFEIDSAIDSINFSENYAEEISQLIEKFAIISPKLMNFLLNF